MSSMFEGRFNRDTSAYGIVLFFPKLPEDRVGLRRLSLTSMIMLLFLLLFCSSAKALEAKETTKFTPTEYVHPLLENCEDEYNITSLSLEDALTEIGGAIEERLRKNDSNFAKHRELEDRIERDLFGKDLWDIDVFADGGPHITNKKDTRLRYPTGFLFGPGSHFEGIERESDDTVRLIYETGSAGTSKMHGEYRFIRYDFVKKIFLGDYIYAELSAGIHKGCLYLFEMSASDKIQENLQYARDAEVIRSFLSELPERKFYIYDFNFAEGIKADQARRSDSAESKKNTDINHLTDVQPIPMDFSFAAEAPSSTIQNPNGVAVIIGNKTYAHDRVPEVRYAHRDADAFRRYVLDVLGFDPDNVIDYRDADKAKLEAAFGNEGNHRGQIWRRVNSEMGSDVVVFYSGHGVPGLNDKRGYLLPVNADPNEAELNGYSIDLLYRNLAELSDARSVHVFLDACFSGDSGGGHLVRSASPVYVTPSLPGDTEGMTVLTASSGAEVASWDEETGHGLFTHHLLDALYGKGDADGDGSVTALEAKAYLDREMTGAARRSFGRIQNASLRGEATTVLAAVVSSEEFPQRPMLDEFGHRPEEAQEDKRDGNSSAAPYVPPTWQRNEDSTADVTEQVMNLLKGITLADWALLAERRLASGDYSRLVTEAKELSLAYGPDPRVLSVAERAVNDLAQDATTIVETNPWDGLSQIH